MAIQDIQGLDNITSVTELKAQSMVWSNSSGVTFDPVGGRWGGGALNIGLNEGFRSIGGNSNPCLCFHIKLPAGFSSFSILRSTTNSGYYGSSSVTSSPGYHGEIHILADGSVRAYGDRGLDRGQLFPPATLVAGTWYYISLWLNCATSGTAKMRLDNTVATINSDFYDSIYGSGYTYLFGTTGGGNPAVFDDIVSGSGDQTGLTPQRIYHLKPNADRAAADFTPLGGGTGFAELDEAIPDGDTSYIYSGTTGHISEFEFEDLPAGVTNVTAVSLITSASRETTGTAALTNSLHTSIDTAIGTSNQVVNDGVYGTARQVFSLTNPDTAAAFTPAELNGLYVKHEVAE